MTEHDDEFVSSKRIRERYDDISDMTLWRWENDILLGFPKPIRINRRKYWRLSELISWERERAKAA